MNQKLIEDLCRCLAFHATETETTLQHMHPPAEEWEAEVANAKRLIAEAGFDFDKLYPVEDLRASAPPMPSTPPDSVLLDMAMQQTLSAFKGAGGKSPKRH